MLAELSYAVLTNADLSGANLSGALLAGAYLINTDLSNAIIRSTIWGNVDLRTVKGLETVWHKGPSTIGTNTIERSQGDIPEVFLHAAGLSDTFEKEWAKDIKQTRHITNFEQWKTNHDAYQDSFKRCCMGLNRRTQLARTVDSTPPISGNENKDNNNIITKHNEIVSATYKKHTIINQD